MINLNSRCFIFLFFFWSKFYFKICLRLSTHRLYFLVTERFNVFNLVYWILFRWDFWLTWLIFQRFCLSLLDPLSSFQEINLWFVNWTLNKHLDWILQICNVGLTRYIIWLKFSKFTFGFECFFLIFFFYTSQQSFITNGKLFLILFVGYRCLIF